MDVGWKNAEHNTHQPVGRDSFFIDIALKTYRFEMVYFNNSNEIYNNMENTT